MGRALALLVLAALVMLPRLASPQFGLLDDGLTLQTGREVHGRWGSVLDLIPETGRFFPAYWLAYSGIWSLVGNRPLAFFAVNVLLFAGLLMALARLVRSIGGTPAAAVVAAILFALSGPAIETFYTLSKAEPLQAVWIGVSLLATAAWARTARWSVSRAAWLVLAAAAALLAHATKETSLVLIPIALGWLLVECRARPRDGTGIRFAASYVAVTLVGAAAFAALRWQYATLALAEGTYTRAYGPAAVGPAVFRITAWMLRDFSWLLPALVAAVLLVGGRRRAILYPCVWMVGWLAVYLPWPATFEYYLLPFALGAAALAGVVVGEAWGRRARAPHLAWSLLVALGLLWSMSVVNASVDARVQLAVDRANTDLVDFLGTLPRDSRVVLNMTPVNEYHFEVPMHLAELKGRRDIIFLVPFQPPESADPALATFVATPEMAHPPGPTVRIALHEAGVRHDQVTLAKLLPDGGTLAYRFVERVGLVELGLQRLLCPLGVGPVFDPAYCPRDRGVIFRRTFVYGWQVHRVVHRAANAATMAHGG